jgi:hypothetical protein
MPLKVYLPLHAEARLTDDERSRLAQGLKRSFRTEEWE